MTYKELLQKIEDGDYDDYEDRVDESIEISLIESREVKGMLMELAKLMKVILNKYRN